MAKDVRETMFSQEENKKEKYIAPKVSVSTCKVELGYIASTEKYNYEEYSPWN